MNRALRRYVLDKESEIEKVANIREYDYQPQTHYFRDDADIDYSRLLYSSSYRRLQGKMQLFVPKSEVFYRNRLTHSHEVAQIAKTIAKKLKLKDYITVQTCSLAHDIGNPPFGHAGEIFLSYYSKLPYEGNAQTLRILRRVEERHYDFNGLNLTLRTLLGVVKYYKKFEEDKHKFLYNEDYEFIKKYLDEYEISHKTIDCEIMDLSDEIAYAVHDLEDALKLKYFTIDELLYEFSINSDFKDVSLDFRRIIVSAKQFAEKSTVYQNSEEYAMLFRKELSSQLVSALILDVDLVDGSLGYKSLKKLCKGLKSLTFKTIKRQPDIIEYEQLGKHILTKLYDMYNDPDFNKNMVLLPVNYRGIGKIDARLILDYIGGMTDLYAISQYEKYFGKLNDKGIYFK